MEESRKNTPILHTRTVPDDFAPTQEQIDALAHRLMPEIRKLFVDEQIQQEFAEWQGRQDAGK